MASKKEKKKEAKSILKTMPDHPALGSYNLHAKRASFKEDGIVVQQLSEKFGKQCSSDSETPVVEDPYDGLTEEEANERRKAFEEKRKAVEGEGFDLKAVLAHTIKLDDDDELDEGKSPIPKVTNTDADFPGVIPPNN